MQHSKLGLVLILGSVGLLAILSSRVLATARSTAGRPALLPNSLPPGRRLTHYHLLTPSRN